MPTTTSNPDLEVVADPSRPGVAIVRLGSHELVVTREQGARLEVALAACFDRVAQALTAEPTAQNAWQTMRENARLREQNRLLGERHLQLERLVASAFARSVSMLTRAYAYAGAGDYPGPRRLGTGKLTETDPARESVRLLEDYVRAEQLLREGGVECETVSQGVRLLLANQGAVDTAMIVFGEDCLASEGELRSRKA